MFDFIGHPDAEGFSTSIGTISVGTEDACSTNGFSELVLRIVSAKEAVFDEIAHGLAMGTLGDFDLGIELLKFDLRRANSAAHDKLSHRIAKISPAFLESVSLERSQVHQNQIDCGFDKTGAG